MVYTGFVAHKLTHSALPIGITSDDIGVFSITITNVVSSPVYTQSKILNLFIHHSGAMVID